MKILTGLLLITVLLFSSCAKETEDIIIQQTPATELTESELPIEAFNALQVLKTEMAIEAAPEREYSYESRNSCNFPIHSNFVMYQNVCGFSTNSYGSIRTGHTYDVSLPHPDFPSTVTKGSPQVRFRSDTTPHETFYYWIGVYDYAKGKYAYTKAGWGDIGLEYHTFDFTPNKWHNSRIVVWKQDVTGTYGWRLVTSLWTMPFTN